jgi:hypothetical protein
LLEREAGQHRARGLAHRVTPLVVVWGKAQLSIPEDAQCDGVSFVGGRSLRSWLRGLEGEPIDRQAAKELVRQLEELRDGPWANLRNATGSPT